MAQITNKQFKNELKRLTQLAYLIGAGVTLICESDPQKLSETLASRVQNICGDRKKVRSLSMKPIEIKKRSTELDKFTADLLQRFYPECSGELMISKRA